MLKNIYFESSKRKRSYYISDNCIDDPDFLSKKNLNKFKRKIINNYHWNNSDKMKKDYSFLKEFIKKKKKEIINKLNKYHSIKMSDKYWKIIIFPWLNYITYILFDRWELVRLLKNKNKYLFHTYNFKDFDLVPTSFENIHFKDKNLNLMIYTKIIDFINCHNIKKNKIFYTSTKKKNLSLKIFLFKFINLLSVFFKNRIIINNLGITFYDNLKLHLYIFQFPFLWVNPQYKKKEIDIIKRRNIFRLKNYDNTKSFENFFDDIIYLLIPKSYLEDFKSINEAIRKSYWPKKCKKIVTAYEYKRNDLFKIWTANMVNMERAKYYIMQHGGNFGSPAYQTEEDVQIEVADKFFTWGWSKINNKKIIPFNAFQFNFIKKKKLKKNGKILICLHCHGKYSYRISSLPKTNFDRLNKLLQIKNLVNNLKDKSNIIIRYPKNISANFGISFKESLFFNYIKFDHCEEKLSRIINKFKIVIHDNDTSTFLMSMFLNIPTILLLDKKLEKFRDSAQKFYDNLEKKNILFYDSLKAAKFINSLDSSLDNWWLNADLQKIRKEFCLNFSKESYKPLSEIKKLLIIS